MVPKNIGRNIFLRHTMRDAQNVCSKILAENQCFSSSEIECMDCNKSCLNGIFTEGNINSQANWKQTKKYEVINPRHKFHAWLLRMQFLLVAFVMSIHSQRKTFNNCEMQCNAAKYRGCKIGHVLFLCICRYFF